MYIANASQEGVVNFELNLSNALNGETLTCTFPINVEKFGHTKDLFADSLTITDDGRYIVTYLITTAMPV